MDMGLDVGEINDINGAIDDPSVSK